MAKFRTRYLVAAALFVGSLVGTTVGIGTKSRDTKESKTGVFCQHDPKTDDLFVFDSDRSDSQVILPAKIKITDFSNSTKPLALVCSSEGILWWIDTTSLYKSQMKLENGQIKVEALQQFEYTLLPEYKEGGARVAGADILLLASDQIPYVATVTNNGWFEAFRPPKSGPSIEDKYLIPFRGDGCKLAEEDRWPGSVSSVVVGVLGSGQFSIIPVCNTTSKDCQTARYYYIGVSNKHGEIQPVIYTFDLREDISTIVSITSAAKIQYDEDRGGWVSKIVGIDTEDKLHAFLRILVPKGLLSPEKQSP